MGTALAVLLFVLKIIGILLLVILALLIIILITPVGVDLLWEPSCYSIHARFGPVRYLLMPRKDKEKPEKTEKKHEEKVVEKKSAEQNGTTHDARKTSDEQKPQTEAVSSDKKEVKCKTEDTKPEVRQETKQEAKHESTSVTKPATKTESKQEPKPEEKQKPKQEKKQEQKQQDTGLIDDIKDAVRSIVNELRGDPLGTIQRLLDEFGPMVGQLLHGIHVSHLRVLWTITGEDAAQTAINYGKAMTLSNVVLERVQELMDVRADSLRIEPDFTNQMTEMRHLSCQITVRPCIILIIGLKLLWRFLQVRKKRNKKK